jgi:pimeloyl-ACP methyl ester carboxylesterase
LRNQNPKYTLSELEDISLRLTRFHTLSVCACVLAILASAHLDAAEPTAFKVQVTGQGAPIIFIPGFTCPGSVWDATVDVIVGHSVGGVLALWLAEKEPTLVSKLVVVDTLPFIGIYFKPHADAESIKPVAEAFRRRHFIFFDDPDKWIEVLKTTLK